MKSFAVAAIALFCVFAMTMAQYPYGYGGVQQGSSGLGGGLLGLIGLLFVLFFLFNSSSTGTGSSTIIYGNFSSPTGK